MRSRPARNRCVGTVSLSAGDFITHVNGDSVLGLTLSDLELVLADDTPDDASDNETYHPHLPGNGKLDLVARRCFDVEPGQVRTLQIDMDAGKSIHVVRNKKNRFNFRPVVFVEGELLRLLEEPGL